MPPIAKLRMCFRDPFKFFEGSKLKKAHTTAVCARLYFRGDGIANTDLNTIVGHVNSKKPLTEILTQGELAWYQNPNLSIIKTTIL
jgi:hypothetical protein